MVQLAKSQPCAAKSSSPAAVAPRQPKPAAASSSPPAGKPSTARRSVVNTLIVLTAVVGGAMAVHKFPRGNDQSKQRGLVSAESGAAGQSGLDARSEQPIEEQATSERLTAPLAFVGSQPQLAPAPSMPPPPPDPRAEFARQLHGWEREFREQQMINEAQHRLEYVEQMLRELDRQEREMLAEATVDERWVRHYQTLRRVRERLELAARGLHFVVRPPPAGD